MNETTVSTDYSTCETLYLAFELAQEKWKLGFTSGVGQPVWKRVVPGGDVLALGQHISLAKERFGLSEPCRVVSCYEAGRDGFWLHRCLLAEGIENRVVDSASIEVNRRAKRAKTDRLDVEKLVTMLVRFEAGEQKVWSVVHVPSPEVEDQRHLHRELHTLKVDRTRHINRIKGILSSGGKGQQERGERGQTKSRESLSSRFFSSPQAWIAAFARLRQYRQERCVSNDCLPGCPRGTGAHSPQE